MNQDLVERIGQCPTLPSLPALAVQVLELAQRPDVDIAHIARIISKDPALAGKILRTVNSSFYGRGNSVSTISHALVILGLQSVKTLVLGFSLVTNLKKAKRSGFDHVADWKRSIYAATAARTAAAKVGIVQQEEAFLAALLQDIGMLVLDQVLGDAYGAVNNKAATHEDRAAVEAEALGMTHAQAGGILVQKWNLPPLLCAPIASHHAPPQVADPTLRKLAEVVQLSGRCADVFVDEAAAGAITRVRQSCGDLYGLNEADADALLADIGKRTREVAGIFDIPLDVETDYDVILKKANQALVDITLQSQQQTTQLQARAHTLQQTAANLAEQNQQLKIAATVDGLTGLSNRARFDAFLAERFGVAVEQSKPLSLLMLDVDKFKSINDRHGHQVGDRALKYLGRLLMTAARSRDLAARYGGEELTLVLPDSPRATAAAIAESIRRAIAAKPLPLGDGRTLPLTASIGVATLEPGCPFREPAHLLKAADLAVYAAKHAGRNCVRVFSIPPAAA